MSTYEIRWYNEEKTIILEQVLGRWVWEDILAMMKEQFALMDTVEHTVHVILIAPEGRIPVPADALFHLQKIVSEVHPREGLKVLVGAPKLIEILFAMIGRVYKLRELLDDYAFAETLEEALATIEKTQM
jgi:hypothetical protein